ncbi:hypothetical protein CASFOL_009975 [Castilleja foliolosa]|uniref:Mitochondrial transcription termination factor n=1 Tax=Castilleja foliolosa TaxID=1961234 RepID=A0ABD3DRD6_9LAMI
MFTVFLRRVRVTTKGCNLIYQQQFSENAVSTRSCSSSVCENASQKSLVVSYLINTCGLSPDDAVSASKKMNNLCFKSPENPDAVLKLLRAYGFTDAHHIPKIVTRWPDVLLASPSKTLFPKFEFLRSIGVRLPVLAHNLSIYPFMLRRSLKNWIIPLYNDLKSLLGSDERVAHVFSRSPAGFMSFDVSIFRERGVPESSIITLVMYQPALLVYPKKKLSLFIDRAVAMGFDISKSAFVHAVRVFSGMSELTLKRKMEVYRRCGCTESDINIAFLRHPLCMSLSEKKITANMDFLVNTLGYKPAVIAQHPVLLSLSLDKRIKSRCLVARALNEKGLKKMPSMTTMLKMPEEKFLNQYIVKHEKDIPNLLDIYRGKSNRGP